MLVTDAGTEHLPQPLVGQHGEVKPCPSQHAAGEDCELCGGTGFRRVCNMGECHEYGCIGTFCYCASADAPQPKGGE